MFLPGRHLLPPGFPSAPHSAAKHTPVHKRSHRHTNTCTSWGQAESAPRKWLQQVRRTSSEATQQAREEQTTLLGCMLLSTSDDGTVIPGFRQAAEDHVHQGCNRLVLKSAEVKGSISTVSSGLCPLLGWASSSRADPGIGGWR